MPPVRTAPPVKPVKTERTHEENQERAYIAASRRSDRSLEARVESARRASEIHKRRTGRSLRVTEQDVINEEMYEEEDDGLPLQYRRLTAHLQTGSADFNRRLAAYLASNVAMRSALDQAITSSYEQQFPNARQFSHNQPGMFPSPFLPQGMGYQPAQQPQALGSPQSPHHSPHQYRQAPYPMPGTPGFRQSSYRSGSIGSPSDIAEGTQQHPLGSPQAHNRRMSMPASMHNVNHVPLTASDHDTNSPTISTVPDNHSWQFAGPSAHMSQQVSISPFTTSLPLESQMLVGAALDPNDPFTSMLMAGGESVGPAFNDSQFFDFNPKDAQLQTTLQGINSTLAPDAPNAMLSPTHVEEGLSASDPSFMFGPQSTFDASGTELKGIDASSSNSDPNTTPPVDSAGWESYINESYQN